MQSSLFGEQVSEGENNNVSTGNIANSTVMIQQGNTTVEKPSKPNDEYIFETYKIIITGFVTFFFGWLLWRLQIRKQRYKQ